MGEIEEERFGFVGPDPLHRLGSVSLGQEFLIGRHLDQFATADQGNPKGELVADVEQAACLTLPRRGRNVVTAGRAVVVIEAAFQRMHRALGEILRVSGQVPFAQDRGGVPLLLEHGRHQLVPRLGQFMPA